MSKMRTFLVTAGFAALAGCASVDPYATTTTPLTNSCATSPVNLTVRLHPHSNGVAQARRAAGGGETWNPHGNLTGWYDREQNIAHAVLPRSRSDKAAIGLIIHEMTHAVCGPGHVED